MDPRSGAGGAAAGTLFTPTKARERLEREVQIPLGPVTL